jgi:hypothetical protein
LGNKQLKQPDLEAQDSSEKALAILVFKLRDVFGLGFVGKPDFMSNISNKIELKTFTNLPKVDGGSRNDISCYNRGYMQNNVNVIHHTRKTL